MKSLALSPGDLQQQRSAARRASGFVALSMLLMLVFCAAAWMHVPDALLLSREDSRADRALHNIKRSARVVDALAAHSVMYHDHYGPSGAGPGHVPCPDTDAHIDLPPERRALSRAGPNPPCASRPEVHGVTPAHISVATLRAGVDVEAGVGYPLSYAVLSDVVNNPTGRIVNTELLSQATTLARIGVARQSAHVASQRPLLPLPLRSHVVHAPVKRRVTSWLINQLASSTLLPSSGCHPPTGCELSALYPLKKALVEGVTAERHWFWRNQWDLGYWLMVDAICADSSASCRWHVDPAGVATVDEQPGTTPVLLTLQDVSVL